MNCANPSTVVAACAVASLTFTYNTLAQGPVYEALLKRDPEAAAEYAIMRAQIAPPPQAKESAARPPALKASPLVDHPDNLVGIARLREESTGASGDDPKAVAVAAQEIDALLTSMQGKPMANA
ncbi:MAG: hypothetical protein ACI8T1_005137 [Verrucomicrobiales bacterium]|jgi:hypothetical protein